MEKNDVSTKRRLSPVVRSLVIFTCLLTLVPVGAGLWYLVDHYMEYAEQASVLRTTCSKLEGLSSHEVVQLLGEPNERHTDPNSLGRDCTPSPDNGYCCAVWLYDFAGIRCLVAFDCAASDEPRVSHSDILRPGSSQP